MPIHISITADTAIQARALMSELLGRGENTPAEVAVAEPQPEKPKATRSTKAKTDAAAEKVPNAETVAALEAAERGETETVTIEQLREEAKTGEPVTEAALRERATKYAAQGGPLALVEMQKAAGAPAGKMSEICASPDAMVKLDALLADAGF